MNGRFDLGQGRTAHLASIGAHGVHARQRVSDNGHLPLAVAHALVLIYRPSGAGTSANAIRGSVLTPDIWT